MYTLHYYLMHISMLARHAPVYTSIQQVCLLPADCALLSTVRCVPYSAHYHTLPNAPARMSWRGQNRLAAAWRTSMLPCAQSTESKGGSLCVSAPDSGSSSAKTGGLLMYSNTRLPLMRE